MYATYPGTKQTFYLTVKQMFYVFRWALIGAAKEIAYAEDKFELSMFSVDAADFCKKVAYRAARRTNCKARWGMRASNEMTRHSHLDGCARRRGSCRRHGRRCRERVGNGGHAPAAPGQSSRDPEPGRAHLAHTLILRDLRRSSWSASLLIDYRESYTRLSIVLSQVPLLFKPDKPIRRLSTAMTTSSTPKLFEPIQIGSITLGHRVALAPLTRYRANKAHVHGDLAVEYYSQRATFPGTLLITEATFIAAKAGGYNNIPGIWNQNQIDAWKRVSDVLNIAPRENHL